MGSCYEGDEGHEGHEGYEGHESHEGHEGHEGYEGHEEEGGQQDREGEAREVFCVPWNQGEDRERHDKGQAHEEQEWQDCREGSFRGRKEALCWQQGTGLGHLQGLRARSRTRKCEPMSCCLVGKSHGYPACHQFRGPRAAAHSDVRAAKGSLCSIACPSCVASCWQQ